MSKAFYSLANFAAPHAKKLTLSYMRRHVAIDTTDLDTLDNEKFDR